VILELLQPEVTDFIDKHEHSDINELLLKYKNVHGIPAAVIAAQIRGRQKAKEKLPTLYSMRQIVYPPSVNLEQSSSEATALFKLNFVQKLFGSKVQLQGADLSGGFGIDALFMSKAFSEYHFVEPVLNLFR